MKSVSRFLSYGIKDLWVQQGAETRSAIDEFKKEEINLISKECIMMFRKPNSVHSFHRFLKKIFGELPA
jgi:predicted CoA-binding protein